jgi:hypothetical protein
MTGTGADHAGGPSEQAAGRHQEQSWWRRRRDKVIAEIQRNRRGEYKVPTWVLAAILVAIVAAWAAVIIFA